MKQCIFKWIDKKTHMELQCSRVVKDELEYCCMHDPKGFTGCRYNYRNLNMRAGTLEEFCTKCGNVLPAKCI